MHLKCIGLWEKNEILFQHSAKVAVSYFAIYKNCRLPSATAELLKVYNPGYLQESASF